MTERAPVTVQLDVDIRALSLLAEVLGSEVAEVTRQMNRGGLTTIERAALIRRAQLLAPVIVELGVQTLVLVDTQPPPTKEG